MGTLLGMSLFSAIAAMTIDKLYESFIHASGTAFNVGRYAAFTGTWTAVSTGFGIRKIRKSTDAAKGRASVARRFIDRKRST